MPAKKRPAPMTDGGIQAAARARDFLAPVFSQYPVEVASAQGVWLTNSLGERVLDLYGGHAVASLGYAHPAWTAALARQAEVCQFQSNAVAMRVRARAARRLVRFSRLPFASVFLVNSGAEANENALKVALRMTGRPHVAAIEGGFHGRTAAAGAVSWGAQAKWYGFPRTPFEVSFIPRGDTAAIAAEVTKHTAAVIVEPVQGLAGAVDLGAPFLAALRARCDEVGALLIFDEVQCGVGRTGEPFAANLYGVRPDMLTTAKGLGNGFPCAVLMLSPLGKPPSSQNPSAPPSAADPWRVRRSRPSLPPSRTSGFSSVCGAWARISAGPVSWARSPRTRARACSLGCVRRVRQRKSRPNSSNAASSPARPATRTSCACCRRSSS